ncbi:hypothetical protein E4631_23970 [Hymenobacter sp. UV11]|uniref:hypothetical protein n=1 Tax=Hymenobacter sp. UV11 TaxID=1849735 RepID=UPI00105D77EB|nr:hypothetical protein [Hymenobacter sp. UV11]TDN38583.1 hypothetical protein A8B98_22830 [Hymenobacter sp. UV11]TFZ62988.1 hypothetical protein E4631_23970 [Hymenobacter sp. UV11]
MKRLKFKKLRRRNAPTALPSFDFKPSYFVSPHTAFSFDEQREESLTPSDNESPESGMNWLHDAEERGPSALGRFEVEYDEDGVPYALAY